MIAYFLRYDRRKRAWQLVHSFTKEVVVESKRRDTVLVTAGWLKIDPELIFAQKA